ncbi:MAG: ATP-binding protein [Candidatus Sulfotelmatobacter sp.]
MTDRQRLADCRASSADKHHAEVEDLRARLREAEEALELIRSGEVDAVVVGGPLGRQIYSITNADRPYRLLIEQMKEGAVTLTSTGLIAYCNDSFAALLGKYASQITGSQIEQFIVPADLFHFQKLLSSVKGGRIVLTLVSDGLTEIPVSLSLSPLPDSGERRIVCGIVTDLRQLRQSSKDLADAGLRLADQIAVRERTEALLHQAQKMEVVGQLTGGLAHDFNNLLMIIGGNLNLIRKSVTDSKTVQRLDQVLGAVQRGGKLTQQLLAFSRTQTLSPQSICINDLLTEVEMLIRRAVGSSVEVRLHLAPDLWFCRADPNQLESAVLNLAINARDAMPTGGSVSIKTQNVLLDAAAVSELGEIAPGRYATITLSDTGTGMAKEVLARVFEPFYTTKEVGKGSGLGLSQVYGFARQSGGHISIQSVVGEGTDVRLYLPWTEPVEALVPIEAAKTASPVHGLSKILIVEDNNELRELATQLVEGLGYSACSASTGAEAIAVLAHDPKIDILFTDVLMPGGMNGFELAVEVRRARPEIAILVTSGFPGTLLPSAQQHGGLEMIPKPFTQAELAAALAKVCAEPRVLLSTPASIRSS